MMHQQELDLESINSFRDFILQAIRSGAEGSEHVMDRYVKPMVEIFDAGYPVPRLSVCMLIKNLSDYTPINTKPYLAVCFEGRHMEIGMGEFYNDPGDEYYSLVEVDDETVRISLDEKSLEERISFFMDYGNAASINVCS